MTHSLRSLLSSLSIPRSQDDSACTYSLPEATRLRRACRRAMSQGTLYRITSSTIVGTVSFRTLDEADPKGLYRTVAGLSLVLLSLSHRSGLPTHRVLWSRVSTDHCRHMPVTPIASLASCALRRATSITPDESFPTEEWDCRPYHGCSSR